MIWTEL